MHMLSWMPKKLNQTSRKAAVGPKGQILLGKCTLGKEKGTLVPSSASQSAPRNSGGQERLGETFNCP